MNTKALLLRFYFCILLIFMTNATVQENRALIDVSCDDSGMHVQMNFPHSFKGIVFTQNNYYNPNCSYAASPTSTSHQLNFTLPHEECGIQFSNESIAYNTIVVLQHRMLDTVYDYVHNVSCELNGPIGNTSTSFEHLKVDSWIKLELGESLFPEETAEMMGISSKLMLTYHVSDGGVHQDMIVMNCIGHDDLVIDENTKLYQISNPYGCISDSDFVSNFSLVKNIGSSSMVAYAALKNVSLFVRGKFYITCGAKLCETFCPRRCEDIDQQNEPLYFNDMATKNMVNRATSSQMPSSLSAFERFDRNRRSYNETAVDLVFRDIAKDQTLELMQKLSKITSKQPEADSRNGITSPINALNNEDKTLNVSFERKVRRKRAVKFQKTSFLPVLNLVVIKPLQKDAIYNLKPVKTNNSTSFISIKSTKLLPEVSETYAQVIEKRPVGNFSSPRVNRYIKKSESSVLMCTIRALITIFALFCLSFACYSVFFSTRDIGSLSV